MAKRKCKKCGKIFNTIEDYSNLCSSCEDTTYLAPSNNLAEYFLGKDPRKHKDFKHFSGGF